MKKVITAIIIILIIICISVGIILHIQSNNNNVTSDNDINTDMPPVATIEIRGITYKDINSIPKLEVSFNNNLIYAEPIKEGTDSYVKLSDTFFINENTNGTYRKN